MAVPGYLITCRSLRRYYQFSLRILLQALDLFLAGFGPLSIIRVCSMNTGRKDSLLIILAAVRGQMSRKELERNLAKARKRFEGSRAQYNSTSTQLQDLQQANDQARTSMQQAQQDMSTLYDTLQTMDMTGANAARDRSDVRTYYVDGKEYHVDKSDANDIKMTPWKKYKAERAEEECMDCGDADDVDVDDIANAADTFAALCE